MANMTLLMKQTQQRLRETTKDCNIEMHEPDNQGVSATVRGDHLDNAMGDLPAYNCGEFTVSITDGDGNTDHFNLATLIALARKT